MFGFRKLFPKYPNKWVIENEPVIASRWPPVHFHERSVKDKFQLNGLLTYLAKHFPPKPSVAVGSCVWKQRWMWLEYWWCWHFWRLINALSLSTMRDESFSVSLITREYLEETFILTHVHAFKSSIHLLEPASVELQRSIIVWDRMDAEPTTIMQLLFTAGRRAFQRNGSWRPS